MCAVFFEVYGLTSLALIVNDNKGRPAQWVSAAHDYSHKINVIFMGHKTMCTDNADTIHNI